MTETDVLVAGAGPVGLTAAGELRRHRVGCRIVDRLAAPAGVAKAVGVQLDAATPMRGQQVFVNGEKTADIWLELPSEVPFGFAALPQYETERVLTQHLRGFDTSVERGVELTLSDAADEFRAAYDARGGCGYLVRPDGYVGYRAGRITTGGLLAHLAGVFAE